MTLTSFQLLLWLLVPSSPPVRPLTSLVQPPAPGRCWMSTGLAIPDAAFHYGCVAPAPLVRLLPSLWPFQLKRPPFRQLLLLLLFLFLIASFGAPSYALQQALVLCFSLALLS